MRNRRRQAEPAAGLSGAGEETVSMSIEVKVPDIGDFSDVPVVSILVSVGDVIAEEDPVVELESDKATLEVPSPVAGKVAEIRVAAGDKVSEGSLLLILEGEGGAEVPAVEAAAPAAAPAAPAPAPAAAPAPVTDAGFGKAHASPSVRAFARSLGVDLAQVNGSGRKGRILREDVTAHFKAASAPAAAAGSAQGGMGIPPIPAVDFSKFGPVEEVEMPRIKKISGPALHRSWLNIPHVTHNEEADITDLDAYRRELDAEAKQQGYRVTLLSFVTKASVSALKAHWEVNSSLHPDGDRLIRKAFYNIGFAADTPNGLVVPVIRDADRKGIVEISRELGELSAKAREGKLKGEEMQGATFTISSLGGIGGTSFTPIVNAPEVAILGLTRAKMAPVWDGEQFVPRLMQPLSLSYDHRAIDGALAARFCATLKYLLGDVRRLML
ncbi:dihydrolipoyllysine-residue acetyltransferase [Actibacterium sp. MT2.3-13A]|uniref:dihydrolipoyllysine-residue acetyltransferase n=1 Tax=Actibacterium sp. MT2.3-13A TaxID=2828332 RepID=UPI001BA4E4C8